VPPISMTRPGRLVDRVLSSGAKSIYRYDDDHFLQAIDQLSPQGAVSLTAFETDDVGHVTKKTEGGQVTAYSYDVQSNRKTETKNGKTYHYICGSGVTKMQLLEIRQDSITGPLVSQFVYDCTLESVQKFAANNQATTYTYDPYGYRIQSSGVGGTRKYYLEGKHLDAIYDGNNALKAKYYRGAIIDEVINADEYSSADPNSWTNQTYHHDQVMTARVVRCTKLSYCTFSPTSGRR
jgi:YD repeat-containing protein